MVFKSERKKKDFGNLTSINLWKRVITMRAKIISLLNNEKLTPKEKVKTLRDMRDTFGEIVLRELLINDKKIHKAWLNFMRKAEENSSDNENLYDVFGIR